MAVIIYGNLWKLPSSAEWSWLYSHCTLIAVYLSYQASKRHSWASLFCRKALFVTISALLCLGNQQPRYPSVWGRDSGSSMVCQPAGDLFLLCDGIGYHRGLWTTSELTCGWRVNKSVPSVASWQTHREGPRLELLQCLYVRAPCWRPVCSSWQTQIKQTVFAGNLHAHEHPPRSHGVLYFVLWQTLKVGPLTLRSPHLSTPRWRWFISPCL